ncbi:MAG: PHB depolymerase family esterase, partial [Burkholderiaceae bacterium]
EQMREATRLTQSGRLLEASEVIQRALSGAISAVPGQTPANPAEKAKVGATRSATSTAVAAASQVLDGCVSEPATAPDGEFIAGSHTHAGLTRDYKLYVPPGRTGKHLPMVVMLHGCTQNPDDFAAGTGMNVNAREQGFFVLYPAQAPSANPSRCWNWFKHNHQQRGRGEPALLASLTRSVMAQYGVDPSRVYIAGLSAGGAMAAIMAAAYPDIFAAVGVHSGLPSGVATNLTEALAAMKSGGADAIGPTRPAVGVAPTAPVPLIVFHGDQDRTVHPRNGDQLIEAELGHIPAGSAHLDLPASTRVEQGVSSSGRRYTRSVHLGSGARSLAEHWVVHGAGHAWSGGHAEGSYTDPDGPDATREMLRFFFEHPHAPAH